VREGAVHQARTLTSDTLGAFGRKVGDLAETLASGTSLMRICPIWLLGWISLCKQAVYGWLDAHAATMGAAIAYYTVFSLAPMLVMVIGVAGLAFGREAAEGALFGELAELIGPESAEAVQALLRSASSTRSGIVATAIGIGTLIIAGTAVFGQLQSALNVIWKAPASGNLGVWYLLKSRLLSLSVILVIGFLLLVSLVISTALAAFSDYLDRILAGLATILRIVHLTFSFGFTTVLFATMFKILPDHPVEWEEVWLGAAIAALLFTVGKHLISLYIGSRNMASTYGAAGALIIVFWYGSITRPRSSCSAPSSRRPTAIRGGRASNCGKPHGLLADLTLLHNRRVKSTESSQFARSRPCRDCRPGQTRGRRARRRLHANPANISGVLDG
jgi:membrane protein